MEPWEFQSGLINGKIHSEIAIVSGLKFKKKHKLILWFQVWFRVIPGGEVKQNPESPGITLTHQEQIQILQTALTIHPESLRITKNRLGIT